MNKRDFNYQGEYVLNYFISARALATAAEGQIRKLIGPVIDAEAKDIDLLYWEYCKVIVMVFKTDEPFSADLFQRLVDTGAKRKEVTFSDTTALIVTGVTTADIDTLFRTTHALDKWFNCLIPPEQDIANQKPAEFPPKREFMQTQHTQSDPKKVLFKGSLAPLVGPDYDSDPSLEYDAFYLSAVKYGGIAKNNVNGKYYRFIKRPLAIGRIFVFPMENNGELEFETVSFDIFETKYAVTKAQIEGRG